MYWLISVLLLGVCHADILTTFENQNIDMVSGDGHGGGNAQERRHGKAGDGSSPRRYGNVHSTTHDQVMYRPELEAGGYGRFGGYGHYGARSSGYGYSGFGRGPWGRGAAGMGGYGYPYYWGGYRGKGYGGYPFKHGTSPTHQYGSNRGGYGGYARPSLRYVNSIYTNPWMARRHRWTGQ